MYPDAMMLRTPGLQSHIRPSLFVLAFALATSLAAPGAHAQDAYGADKEEEVEEVVVQATRSGRRVQDEPIRVDVINREEIEEKIAMRPGNIAMLLSETGGLRVQVTSPSLGASNVRVQGMRGRYTQLLTDGLPLYGGQASSIGLLQIPPTDLGQVEVIKGAASALYGPSALGGVINLVSRRPSPSAYAETLVNLTTRNGQDLTAYASGPVSDRLSYSIVGGVHRQSRVDLDSDGWADIPGYDRWTLRPRLFWEGANGQTGFLTLGAMAEERSGGTLPGWIAPDGASFRQAQDTRRFDGGAVFDLPLPGIGTLHLRASGTTQKHDHLFGDVAEEDRHDTVFAEASFAAQTGATSWLAGVAAQRDAYRSDTFPAFDYTHSVPALFVQAEHDVTDNLTLAGSARLDAHSEYGSRFSPRLSMLYRPGPWTVRASLGRGFYAPTPFVEEIEAAGLSRLEALADLKAEVAESGSLEGGYARGPFEANLTLFASNIRNAVRIQPVTVGGLDRVRLVNLDGDTQTRGAEALLRYRWDAFTFTGSYVLVEAEEPEMSGLGQRTTPLTPRHTAGFVAMWEKHERGRLGFEAYYTGRQQLEDNPYRETSKPYLELGLMGEVRFGNISVFVNLENLLNVRQTKYDPLVLPRPAPDGRWTVDAWAPTDGFVANGGVRVRFGG
jgi:outer membrane receptor for ferrienterochelin and colicins